MVVAVAYAIMGRCKKWLIALFSVIMAGIWWTAVYSGHHYLIDVMLGISCALLGILVFEQGLTKWGVFKRFFERYSRYIGYIIRCGLTQIYAGGILYIETLRIFALICFYVIGI